MPTRGCPYDCQHLRWHELLIEAFRVRQVTFISQHQSLPSFQSELKKFLYVIRHRPSVRKHFSKRRSQDFNVYGKSRTTTMEPVT